MPTPHPLWICPVCRESLWPDKRTLRCPNNHSYDRAREGYFNLLLANRKHSRNPGDDRQMLRNRRTFLEQGFYQPLLQRLCDIAAELAVLPRTERFRMLDCGAGEGYYTNGISQVLEQQLTDNPVCGGIDISKEAARLAARRYPQIHFAVASASQVPVADHSIDLGLRIFAPAFPQEYGRLIRPRGFFLAVTPGPSHLFELRELIYRHPRQHDQEPPQPLPGMRHVRRETLSFPLQLSQPGQAGQLLAMTPYYWQADAATQQQITETGHFETGTDFTIDLYRHDAS